MRPNVKKLVEHTDKSRRVNPLDLSADQDLTIALMNLVAIEDIAPNSQIGEMVRDIRAKLMSGMGAASDVQISAREYLAHAVSDMNNAMRAQENGDDGTAYKMYDASYESYVLFLATIYEISA